VVVLVVPKLLSSRFFGCPDNISVTLVFRKREAEEISQAGYANTACVVLHPNPPRLWASEGSSIGKNTSFVEIMKDQC
jgi:hypothetical protein